MPEEEETAKFFELVNEVFDILNSRIPVGNRPIASGFGLHLEVQEGLLRKFYSSLANMRVRNSRTLLPFQKGFLTTIRSLLCCFTELKKNYNIKYLLTSRFNQDCLENFFSQIRAVGRAYDHPLPVEFKSRLRLLIMAKNASDIQLNSSSPVAPEYDTSGYLTSNLFTGLIPNMEEALSLIEGQEEMKEVTLYDLPIAPVTLASECSAEGLRYLAGYIAFRCLALDKSLGNPSGKMMHVALDSSSPGWIEKLSRGGLIIPSDDWFETVKQFEVIFALFHGSDISKDACLIKNLIKIICGKFSHLHEEIVKTYVRTRTFIRIRHLNTAAKQQRAKQQQQRKALKWRASAVSTSKLN